MEINDFQIGTEYYVLSSSWFERWSYYYQGIEDSSLSHIKSTKILKKKRSISVARRKSNIHSNSARDISMDNGTLII